MLRIKHWDRLDSQSTDESRLIKQEDDAGDENDSPILSDNMSFETHVRKLRTTLTGTIGPDSDSDAALKKKIFSAIDLLLLDSRNTYAAIIAKVAGFEPTIILVDNAQQLYHAQLFSILTRFNAWQALVLAGDCKQSGPILSEKRSEIFLNAEISAIELLDVAGANVHRLTTQYRMLPGIAKFPMKHFDTGVETKSNAKTTTPNAEPMNPNELSFRRVAREFYIKDKQECNYFFMNVARSLSWRVQGTETLVNYASAEAIHLMVRRMLNNAIPTSDITILCFYSGQVDLLTEKFKASRIPKLKEVRVCTLDAFIGQEASVVIVDFVQADSIDLKSIRDMRRIIVRDEAVVGNDTIGSNDTASPDDIIRASKHIRNHQRINTALTRARDGLVIVGQLPLFVGKVWPGLGSLANTLFWLAEDAWERSLVYQAEDFVDKAVLPQVMSITHEAVHANKQSHNNFVGTMLSRGRKSLKS
ncbi:MAG: hypothetical protein Q9180_002733 [Flavoplaca navasiana]